MIKNFFLKHGLDLDNLDLEAILASFSMDMTAGLRGEPSSLAMIPSYLSCDVKIPINKPVIVIDAGGTNLRVCTVTFDENGAPKVDHFSKHPMPGTDKEVSGDEFFSLLASYVSPLLPFAENIGFCFSYPCEITPDCDGRLIHWSKQIKAPEVEGKLVGSELSKRLSPLGFKGKITVLNDTVATLIAGVSQGLKKNYSNYVGVILGTGTNTATVIDNCKILKAPSLGSGSMIINMETGNFARLPLSDIDEELHAGTMDPGRYKFEKQISGGYLGQLGLTALKIAAREGLFSNEAQKAILALSTLENKDFDDFCDAPYVNGPLNNLPLTDEDRRAIQEIGRTIYARAAKLSAANIAAGIIASGGGTDPLSPVCVNIDGSTYYKTKTAEFMSRTLEALRSLLEKRNLYYRTICIPDSPVIGAAVAGITR